MLNPYSGINIMSNIAFIKIQIMLILDTVFIFLTLNKAPPTEINAEYIEYPISRISTGMSAGKNL
jgi:hypothetical protein